MDEAIWRGRFKQYGPLELVRFAQAHTSDDTAKWALQELDAKLIDMGVRPRAPIPLRQSRSNP